MAAMARVLVVDDNEGIRELVSDVLSWAGHETATARDGVAALEVVQRWSPDVIVLDAMMPRMDGPQFARTYRGLPGPHAPIIALTAALDGPRRAAEMEAAGFVGKPFNPDELLRLVDRYACAAPAGV
jgi:two-component system, HptB-dependent secretion and biofilm response regulator